MRNGSAIWCKPSSTRHPLLTSSPPTGNSSPAKAQLRTKPQPCFRSDYLHSALLGRVAWKIHTPKNRQQKAAAEEPRRLCSNIHEEAILSLAGLATTYSS